MEDIDNDVQGIEPYVEKKMSLSDLARCCCCGGMVLDCQEKNVGSLPSVKLFCIMVIKVVGNLNLS